MCVAVRCALFDLTPDIKNEVIDVKFNVVRF